MYTLTFSVYEKTLGKRKCLNATDIAQGNSTSGSVLFLFFNQEADEDGGGGLDLDEFRQAMIKTMAGRGEIVSWLFNSCPGFSR